MTTLRNARFVALAGLVALVLGGAMASSADAGCGGYSSYASYGCGTSFLTSYSSCYAPPVCAPVVFHKPCLTPVYNYVTKIVCQKFTYPVLAYNCHGCPQIAYQVGTKQVPVTQLVTSYVYR